MAAKTEITRADILPMAQYAAERAERRKALVALKKNRRLSVGPHATFFFENYETMWQQIHEMLRIEKGGEEQIADELRAYNPLIPKGRELVATVMFEIDDADRRHRVLSALGGVEAHMEIKIGGETIRGRSEADVERTNAAGKTSSVHFIHFDFTDAQVDAFRHPGAPVMVGIAHPNYGHLAVMPEAVRAALAEDFA
jgi:hypothetical protein